MKLQSSRLTWSRFAFTLVELLAVVGIIILLVGITVPAVQALTKSNSQAQANNQIRAYFSEARSIAVAQHRQAGVVFFRETAAHALPFHGNQIAMQIFVEDYDQTTSPAKYPKNTLFVPYSSAREYLPAGIAVAALNDAPGKLAINGDSTGGHDLAVLFDATGEMIARHGIARRDFPEGGGPGLYPWAMADWNFATQGKTTDNSSNGISSPGLFLYDQSAYNAQAIAEGAAGDKTRGEWIKKNASVLIVNAHTGALLQ